MGVWEVVDFGAPAAMLPSDFAVEISQGALVPGN
jgi:hypothetical protein